MINLPVLFVVVVSVYVFKSSCSFVRSVSEDDFIKRKSMMENRKQANLNC